MSPKDPRGFHGFACRVRRLRWLPCRRRWRPRQMTISSAVLSQPAWGSACRRRRWSAAAWRSRCSTCRSAAGGWRPTSGASLPDPYLSHWTQLATLLLRCKGVVGDSDEASVLVIEVGVLKEYWQDFPNCLKVKDQWENPGGRCFCWGTMPRKIYWNMLHCHDELSGSNSISCCACLLCSRIEIIREGARM